MHTEVAKARPAFKVGLHLKRSCARAQITVTLTGANFEAGSFAVRFNGLQANVPGGVGFSNATVRVASAATTGPRSMTTVDGSDTNATPFYLPASPQFA